MQFKPIGIITHCSASPDGVEQNFESLRRHHTEDLGWSDIGYHYVIERVGDKYVVILGRPANIMGSHTRGYNDKYLGICIIGNYDYIEPPEDAMRVWADLVADIVAERGFEIREALWFHRDFTGLKTCPGKLFTHGIAAEYLIKGPLEC